MHYGVGLVSVCVCVCEWLTMHTVGRASSRPGRPGYIVSGVDMFVRMIPTAIIIFRVGLVSLIILVQCRERERESQSYL